jgi:hypothetical protein
MDRHAGSTLTVSHTPGAGRPAALGPRRPERDLVTGSPDGGEAKYARRFKYVLDFPQGLE